MNSIKPTSSSSSFDTFSDPILKPISAADGSGGKLNGVTWDGGASRTIPAPPVNVVDNSWLGGFNFNDSFATLANGFSGLVTTLIDNLVKGAKGGWENGVVNPPSIIPPGNPPPITPPITPQSFKERVSLLLDKHKAVGVVSEADLQTAMIAYQLYQKDPALESLFLRGVDEAKSRGVSAVDANKISLKATESSSNGKLTKPDAEWVYRLTFRGAQLDSDHGALKEGSSGAGTLAVDQAIQIAEVTLAQIASGALVPQFVPLY
ncbi:MAG TPA: hypothetical protein PKA63_06750 [Oligoflexia bacterium]|nr:hypothetical protein [Oligoflexia bacterium]HMP48348.1 hypothetical protein [Oligoflexia bacterium]